MLTEDISSYHYCCQWEQKKKRPSHCPKSSDVYFRFYHSFKNILRHLPYVRHNEEPDRSGFSCSGSYSTLAEIKDGVVYNNMQPQKWARSVELLTSGVFHPCLNISKIIIHISVSNHRATYCPFILHNRESLIPILSSACGLFTRFSLWFSSD